MAKYKAYSSYKSANSQWVNIIPLQWTRLPLKSLVSIKITDGPHETPSFIDEGVPFLSVEAIKFNKLDFSRKRAYISHSLHKKYSLKCLPQRDDIFIVKSGNTTGSVAIVDTDDEFNIWSPLALIRCNKETVIPRYVYYSIQADFFQTSVQLSWSQGTQPNIGMGVIENLHITFPELAIQNKIVAFLDHETAKIDKLIEKQQQLIELLKEKRQAVISHAVTKGLNPDAPMKDSGVEWLGEVPEHWTIGYLRWYIFVSSGTYLSNKDFETDADNNCMNPVIGGNGVMGFTSKVNDGNCLVVGRVGALCGNVHQIRESCWVTDNALKITYTCDFDVDYLEIYLKVLDLNKLANHNAQPLITGTMIKDQVAIIPPINEQRNITKFIQLKAGKIDLLIEKSSEAVSKIKERRTALISAAVTGKIDVRDWVAPKTQDSKVPQEASA